MPNDLLAESVIAGLLLRSGVETPSRFLHPKKHHPDRQLDSVDEALLARVIRGGAPTVEACCIWFAAARRHLRTRFPVAELNTYGHHGEQIWKRLWNAALDVVEGPTAGSVRPEALERTVGAIFAALQAERTGSAWTPASTTAAIGDPRFVEALEQALDEAWSAVPPLPPALEPRPRARAASRPQPDAAPGEGVAAARDRLLALLGAEAKSWREDPPEAHRAWCALVDAPLDVGSARQIWRAGLSDRERPERPPAVGGAEVGTAPLDRSIATRASRMIRNSSDDGISAQDALLRLARESASPVGVEDAGAVAALLLVLDAVTLLPHVAEGSGPVHRTARGTRALLDHARTQQSFRLAKADPGTGQTQALEDYYRSSEYADDVMARAWSRLVLRALVGDPVGSAAASWQLLHEVTETVTTDALALREPVRVPLDLGDGALERAEFRGWTERDASGEDLDDAEARARVLADGVELIRAFASHADPGEWQAFKRRVVQARDPRPDVVASFERTWASWWQGALADLGVEPAPGPDYAAAVAALRRVWASRRRGGTR